MQRRVLQQKKMRVGVSACSIVTYATGSAQKRSGKRECAVVCLL